PEPIQYRRLGMRTDAVIVVAVEIAVVTTGVPEVDVLEFGADDGDGTQARNHFPCGIVIVKAAAIAVRVIVIVVVVDLGFADAGTDVKPEWIVGQSGTRCAQRRYSDQAE